MEALAAEHFSAYLHAPAKKVADVARKKELSKEYVEGLLREGGPSTDVFKKALGEEKTAKLFREILFGIA